MTRTVFILFFILGASFAGAESTADVAPARDVRLRAYTSPSDQVVLGQQTRFFVEILTQTWFSEAPRYPELIIEGAIALMPEQLGTNFTEQIDGVSFSGQRRSYVLFPQRTGALVIPALDIPLAISEEGRAGLPFVLRTPPLHLSVVLPAEAEGVENLVTTPDLTLSDRWNKRLDGLSVGDAVERTVSARADRALGLLLPDLSFEAPAGIAVYPDQPSVIDRVNRGQYRGERVERVTYVMQAAGEFTIPAIELHWWNSDLDMLETTTLEARTFEVGASPAGAGKASSPAVDGANLRETITAVVAAIWERRVLLAMLLVGGFLAFKLTGRVWPALRDRTSKWVATRETSERARFRSLERAISGGQIEVIACRFWRWRTALSAEVDAISPEALRQIAVDEGFAATWRAFESARYGAGDGDALDLLALRTALRDYRATVWAASACQPPASPLRLNPPDSVSARRFRPASANR